MTTALSAQSLDLLRIAPALLLAGEHNALGAVRGQLARELAAGRLIRPRRGLYARRTVWDALSATERYQARVLGVARTSGQLPVLSHESAAVIHGLPVVGRWPAVVHQLISPRTGGRSTSDRIRHAAEFDAADVVERDGLALTGLARSASAFTAVASIDEDALRREARAFTRWDYELGMSTTRLAARLALIGVVPERAPQLGWR